jgi:hypothetical protein
MSPHSKHINSVGTNVYMFIVPDSQKPRMTVLAKANNKLFLCSPGQTRRGVVDHGNIRENPLY